MAVLRALGETTLTPTLGTRSAEGGSSIDEWNKEGALFRHAVSEAKFAMGNSELIAILWHQGESDGHSGKYKNFLNYLILMSFIIAFHILYNQSL